NHQQALQMHQNYGAQTQHTAVSRPAAGAESLCSYGVPAEMSGSSAAQQISLGDDPDQIIDPILEQLGDEINSCVRYHDILFPSHQVGKIIFIGGQANNVALCQKVAFRIGLPAQIGDPLVRVDTNGKPNACRDLNLNELNSDWAIAFGLSMNQ
ncbi:MAG: hypothetical protein K9M57_05470, partial [Phycisphaerae bacterium]|nr:hypothetical protein [Phycisphaerae bacterium]